MVEKAEIENLKKELEELENIEDPEPMKAKLDILEKQLVAKVNENNKLLNLTYAHIEVHDKDIKRLKKKRYKPMPKTLEKNINKNKAKIWYYIGQAFLAFFNVTVMFVKSVLPNTLWSEYIGNAMIILQLLSMLLIPLIFGDKEVIQSLESDLAKEKNKNYGLGVTNKMQDYLLEKEGITTPKFDPIDPIEKS